MNIYDKVITWGCSVNYIVVTQITFFQDMGETLYGEMTEMDMWLSLYKSALLAVNEYFEEDQLPISIRTDTINDYSCVIMVDVIGSRRSYGMVLELMEAAFRSVIQTASDYPFIITRPETKLIVNPNDFDILKGDEENE